MRDNLIRETCSRLLREGYAAFYCAGTRGCFDIVARREGELLLLKVLENIDALTEQQALDLRKIALMFGAKYFILGEATKEERMRDGALYERHGVPALSLKTFGEIIAEAVYPEIRKFKTFSVAIDGKKLAIARQELGLSLSELAEKAGISRETLYRYEHGRTGASEENAERLEKVLDVDVRKPIDPFEGKALRVDERTVFSLMGFESVKAKSAPFEFAAKERSKVIAGEEMDIRTMRKRAGIYGKISEIFDSSACFLLRESARDVIEGIPVVRKGEMKEMKKPRDLLKLIEERRE